MPADLQTLEREQQALDSRLEALEAHRNDHGHDDPDPCPQCMDREIRLAHARFPQNALSDVNERHLHRKLRDLEVRLLNFTDSTELTISSGIIAVTQVLHTVDTEADAATDQLDHATGGAVGDYLVLMAADLNRKVFIGHRVTPIANQFRLRGQQAVVLSNLNPMVFLFGPHLSGGNVWAEVSGTGVLHTWGEGSAPGVTDDIDKGFSIGSVWIDVTADKAYICLDNTDGAAVWLEFTPTHTIDLLNLTDETTLTISSGQIARTQTLHLVDTESAAATDILRGMSGGAEGDVVVLRAAAAARDIAVEHENTLESTPAGDRFHIHGDQSLVLDPDEPAVFLYLSSRWRSWNQGRKHSLAKTAAPGTGDDSLDGYSVGSIWIDTSADKAYICLDATSTAAVWTETTIAAASTTVSGRIEVATAAETTTGTDATRAVSPDGLAGSEYGERAVQFIVFDFATDVTVGDGAYYFHIDSRLAGMNLVDVHAEVITAGTTGTTDIQIANVTQSADILSTKLTIDSGETGSDTAAAAAVIDTNEDDMQENDLIRIDIDAASTTKAKGLIVTLGFRLP